MATDGKKESGMTNKTKVEGQAIDGNVAEIWSHGFAEDGKTFCLDVVMEDGTDLFISACPGEPIAFHRTHGRVK